MLEARWGPGVDRSCCAEVRATCHPRMRPLRPRVRGVESFAATTSGTARALNRVARRLAWAVCVARTSQSAGSASGARQHWRSTRGSPRRAETGRLTCWEACCGARQSLRRSKQGAKCGFAKEGPSPSHCKRHRTFWGLSQPPIAAALPCGSWPPDVSKPESELDDGPMRGAPPPPH